MKNWMRFSILGLVVVFGTSLGCVGPTLRGSEQVISDRYPEAEVFYLSKERVVPDDSSGYLPLLPVSQGMDKGTAIAEGAPVTVLAQGVRLPQDAPRRMDAIVVVDVRVAGSDKATEPVVVGYFPNAQPGQRLPFQSLRVFSNDTWDPKFALEFRVRVFDWREKENDRIVTAIQQAEEIGKKLSSGVLVLSDPIVRNAVTAASDLIRRRPNVAIIDFRIGMYSEAQVAATSGRIPLLRQGSWIVAAKPKGTTPEYWMQRFGFADPGQAIYAVKDGKLSERLDLPFLEVAVGQFQTQPGRSRLLEEVSNATADIGSEKWQNDPDAVSRSSFSLWSTASRFVGVRQFEEARDGQSRMDRFRQLFELLSDQGRLQPADRAALLSFVRSKVGETPLPSDPTALGVWWREYGEVGSFGADGIWASPVVGWVRDLRYPPPNSDYRELSGKLVPRLVQALRSRPSAVTTDGSQMPADLFVPSVGPRQREMIVNLFEEARRNSSFIQPFNGSEGIVTWWENLGRFGELRLGPQGPTWCSFAVASAERIEQGRASLADFVNAVSVVTRKPAQSIVQSKTDIDALTSIRLTEDSVVDQSRVLSALRKAASEYNLSSPEAVEKWWTSLGAEGDPSTGRWKSPVPAISESFQREPTLGAFEKLFQWTESGVMSQADADSITRDGLKWPSNAKSNAAAATSFASTREWLAIVKRARQSFINSKLPLDAGNGIREFMPAWRVASTRNLTLTQESLRKLLLLRQAILESSPEYVGRSDRIAEIDAFLRLRTKGPAEVPSLDQWEAFLSGKAVGEGAQSTWQWELPKQ